MNNIPSDRARRLYISTIGTTLTLDQPTRAVLLRQQGLDTDAVSAACDELHIMGLIQRSGTGPSWTIRIREGK